MTNFQTLLSILYKSKKQIAILDETNSLELSEPYASSARVRIFSLAGILAGEEIGKMLLAAGHKKAAFLTTFSDHAWSQKRCSGLRQAFQKAGFQPHSVVEYATAPLPDIIPLVCATARLTSTEARHLFGPDMPVSLVNRAISYAAVIAESLCLTRHETAGFKKQVNALIFLTKATGRSITNATRLGILDDIGADLYRRYLRPLFSRVLADPAITAWVAATDSIGHQARIFLAEKKIAVPGKISLAAFDNSAGAASGRLTSYDFDPENRFQQALSFAVSSPERTRTIRGSNECAGILVERQSTRLLKRYTRKIQSTQADSGEQDS